MNLLSASFITRRIAAVGTAGKFVRCRLPTSSNTSKKTSRAFSTPVPPAAASTLRSPTPHDEKAILSFMEDRQGSVVSDDSTLVKYNSDWTGQYQGKSKLVARPKTVTEISSILQYCNTHKIGVVPQAGNTGVVGGSVPISEELVLSVEGLNEIHSFDEINGIVVCGAGCVLQTLQEKVKGWNHLVPIDMGSKGTCLIGGNVATNAGGQYYYRFGSIHANIIGIEVVLADGTILDFMSTNRKDNTGYDLKHLFVGAEGTLGIITKVALSCPRLPRSKNTAFLACDSFESVRQTLSCAKEELGEIMAAFEFMDKEVLDHVGTEVPIPLKNGDGENYRFCVLVETQGSNADHDNLKLEAFLEKVMEDGNVVDGVVAQDLTQVHDMWEVRESCNPVIKSKGYNYKYDLSLPLSEYYDIAGEMRERLSGVPDIEVVNWGHVCDGNLHMNIVTPGNFEVDQEVKNLIEPFVFESVVKYGGSISAEHGIGQCKNNLLGKYAQNEATIGVMKALKKTFDPNGILNPGKFLPS